MQVVLFGFSVILFFVQAKTLSRYGCMYFLVFQSHYRQHKNLYFFLKKCTNLSGWILITFSTRDITTMLTLFKPLVLSRLDYGSQLWSLHLVKHIDN